MKKATWVFVFSLIFAGFVLAMVVTSWNQSPGPFINNNNPSPTPTPTPSPTPNPNIVNLKVPFVSEAPEGIWKNPWVNACEEASIVMVQKYYQGKESVSIEEAKAHMQILFDAQDRLYGSNINSDVDRTISIINDYTTYKATVKENPTIEDIKNELRAGRPVISPHNGFTLQNPNVHFLATGSGYHMMVIKGFDDERKQFITNDDGDRVDGPDHRYDYDLFMNSIHDYVVATSKTDGPPRVIFTSK